MEAIANILFQTKPDCHDNTVQKASGRMNGFDNQKIDNEARIPCLSKTTKTAIKKDKQLNSTWTGWNWLAGARNLVFTRFFNALRIDQLSDRDRLAMRTETSQNCCHFETW
jgi:hypothetical protein